MNKYWIPTTIKELNKKIQRVQGVQLTDNTTIHQIFKHGYTDKPCHTSVKKPFAVLKLKANAHLEQLIKESSAKSAVQHVKFNVTLGSTFDEIDSMVRGLNQDEWEEIKDTLQGDTMNFTIKEQQQAEKEYNKEISRTNVILIKKKLSEIDAAIITLNNGIEQYNNDLSRYTKEITNDIKATNKRIKQLKKERKGLLGK